MSSSPRISASRFSLRVPLLLLAFSALSLLAGVAARFALANPLGEDDLPFANPSSAVLGPGGLVVLNDSGDRRIVGMERDGTLRFVIPGQRRRRGFYNGRALGFDAAGRFVVDDTILDLDTGNASSEAFLVFDEGGRRLGVAHSQKFSAAESADVVSRMIYTQASKRGLAWFYPDREGRWMLYELLAGRSAAEPGRSFGSYDVWDTVDASVSEDGTAWFLERSGAIRRTRASGQPEPWFEDSLGAFRFPIALAAENGAVYVLEGKRALVKIVEKGGARILSTIFDARHASSLGYAKPLSIGSFSLGPDGAVLMVNEAAGDLLLLDGKSLSVFSHASLSLRFKLLRFALLAAWLAAALSFVVAIILFYARVFGSKARLLLKQLSILVPLTAVAAGAIAWTVYADMRENLEAATRDRLRHIAQLTALRLPIGALDGIDPARGELEDILGSTAFSDLSAAFDEVVNRNQDEWNSTIFPYAYIRREGEWFALGGFDYLEAYPYAYSKPEFSAVLDRGEDVFYRYSDVYGAWLSALTPLKRPDGSVAAVVEASMSGEYLDELGALTLRKMALGTSGLLILLIAVFAVFDWLLLKSVKALKEGAVRVSEGDYDVRVDIRSRDEIQELGDAFNSMSSQIKDYIDRLAKLGRANARFVPVEFLNQLGRGSITEIGLGDQVLTDMSVLFSDIRAFTSLSESMGPPATMDLLNDYLSRMGPAIRGKGGFIDKYIGDAVLALFPGKPADAVDAALAMMAALDQFRAELAERGESLVEAGFGIHTGQLMLGVIGEEERFEGTVIADAVNLASRLESLTKFYGVRAVMSGTVKERINRGKRACRFLDVVRVVGKREPVRLYELIGEGDPALEAKLAFSARYVEAFESYRRARFDEATLLFEAMRGEGFNDRPAEIMLERCRRYLTDGAPSGWKGVTELHEK